jgi:hypothetical protein
MSTVAVVALYCANIIGNSDIIVMFVGDRTSVLLPGYAGHGRRRKDRLHSNLTVTVAPLVSYSLRSEKNTIMCFVSPKVVHI